MYFESLVKRISSTLKRITYKLNGHFSFFNNEDLYQEALMYLWVDFKKGKLKDKTDSYILQGCYFHLKNYIRKNYAKVSSISLEKLINEEDEDFNLDDALFLENRDSSFEFIHCKMLIEKINNNGLTKREKEVFGLAQEGLTIREIGSRLGISHVRVVKLKGRIRDKCRKYLDFL